MDFDKLKGKKITLVYHDSPYGKEPIALLTERSKLHGFELTTIPVTHPGVEQKAAWLQIRQNRPDYVFLWGWGVMNSTAVREAVATGFPRDRMYGVWWAAAEPDVTPVGADAKGFNGLALQHSDDRSRVHEDILKLVHDKGQGTGPKEEVGTVLYTRGMISAMLGVEGVRQAQLRYGVKPLTGEQVRYGLENLTIDAKRDRSAGADRSDAADGHQLPRSRRRASRAHPSMGRQAMELHVRLVRGRHADHPPADSRYFHQVCGGKEDHAPQLRSGDEASGGSGGKGDTGRSEEIEDVQGRGRAVRAPATAAC